MKKNDKQVFILGAGGHARVLIDILRLENATITGILAPDISRREEKHVFGLPVLGDDSLLGNMSPDSVLLVNAIGFLPGNDRREAVFNKFSRAGYQFASVIHPNAIIARDVILQTGVQIMAGVVVQPGSVIGENTILNTGATVDHDCKIGKHCHMAPGVTLCGGVNVADNVFVGAGATVIHAISIGKSAVVRAGTAVTRDVDPVSAQNNTK